MRRLLAALALLVAGCAPNPAPSGEPVSAITNVTVLDGRGGPARPGGAVLVRGERIEAVLPAGARPPREATRIDGAGGWLAPGFIDMHAHLLVPRCEPPPGSDSPFDRAVSERMLAALLDFGITTVRSPATPTVEGLKLRDDLNAGRVHGPRAAASAELINNPSWDEAKLRAYVRDALPSRPDYFKVYARLPPASVRTVVDEAHRHGVPVIGHMGATSWGEAVDLGVDHLTHAVDWSPLMLRPERRATYEAAIKARGPIRARIDWLEQLDPASPEVAAALGKVAARGVSVDPTLVAYDSKFSDPAGPRYRRNPHVDRVPELHADWRACTTITEDWTPEDYRRWAAAWPKMLALVGEMRRRGVLLTTGSDLTNSWVIPGESLHQEFELLREAGLSAEAVLRATGADAARALGRDDVGVIEPGRRADLVLLAADPRADIRNTRRIVWVMQGGRRVSNGPSKPPQNRPIPVPGGTR